MPTSHLRSMLLNHSVMIPIMNGKPVLGQFQSVLLAELDGPRVRSVHVQLVGNVGRTRSFASHCADWSEDRDWRGSSPSRNMLGICDSALDQRD